MATFLLKKLEKSSTSNYVVETIQKAIQNGELRVGDKLPGEIELSASLGLGRSSIREGIKTLVTYGALEVKHGQGTFVADHFVETFANGLAFLPIKENLDSMLSVRRILEMGCMQLIYNRITEQQCNELEELTSKIDPDCDGKTNLVFDGEFHRKLIEYSENPMLIRMYGMIYSMIDYLMESLMGHKDVALAACEAHVEIIGALRKRDLEQSLKAMDFHLQTVEKYAKKYI